MNRLLSKTVINLLAIAIAVPTTLAYAAGGGDSIVGAPAAARVASVTPSLRASTARAVAATIAADHAAAQGPGMPAQPQSRLIRAQGGGKGAMITGLVSTVIGIAGAVYMVKYMKDQQKKTDGQQ
jgi:hypothetical protein